MFPELFPQRFHETRIRTTVSRFAIILAFASRQWCRPFGVRTT
jgi:hypothetical protein